MTGNDPYDDKDDKDCGCDYFSECNRMRLENRRKIIWEKEMIENNREQDCFLILSPLNLVRW